MTLSISARCPESGQLGIAISSSSMAVGIALSVAAARRRRGRQSEHNPAVAGAADPQRARSGASVEQALNLALAEDRFREYRRSRRLTPTATRRCSAGSSPSGSAAPGGDNCVAAGNMLAGQGVIAAMVGAFEAATGELASRLLAGLRARIVAGGEAGPVHSAAVKVVDDYPWPVVDLRIDWAEADPLAALEQLWLAWEPQMDAYITRALDPREAPAYGVPGDE